MFHKQDRNSKDVLVFVEKQFPQEKKTPSGIKRFQEEKVFGLWFQKLYKVVCIMGNCQSEQSIEPHVIKESIEESEQWKWKR